MQAQGPYQLGGWSLGGVIALEMARQLHAQGQEVALLALLDTRVPTPGQWRGLAEQQEARLLAGFVQDLAAQAGQTLDLSSAAVAPDAPEQAMRSVVAQAQAHNLLPDMSVAQIEERFAVFKANLAAVARYVAEDSPCPIVLFRASDSADARTADPQLGWGALAAGALEVVEVAGDHYTMVAQPHVQQLAQRLHLYLAPESLKG